MRLKELQLKNFRCFESKQINFEGNLILIRGHNGSGKSTLLEAMYYLGYLHSFRTHGARELIRSGAQDFFIKARIESSGNGTGDLTHEIQVGFADKKRVVKVDQKAIGSYKELMDFYRIISLTEDDIALVRGEPELRRSFLDQTLMFADQESAAQLRTYRAIVHNRNKLLYTATHDDELLHLWTKQLWHHTCIVQQYRKRVLATLADDISALRGSFFDTDFCLELQYLAKVEMGTTFEDFCGQQGMLFANERRYGRSLFGAHLDDFGLYFNHKQSRFFASRGQQKCMVILLKVAQLHVVMRAKGAAILVLDDFMTDFDMKHIETLLNLLLAQNIQLIFTVPSGASPLAALLQDRGAYCVDIPI